MNEPQLVAALRAAGCVFAEEEARLLLDEASSPGELMAWAARRMAGEPLEYVLGWAAFAGTMRPPRPEHPSPRRSRESGNPAPFALPLKALGSRFRGMTDRA